MSTGGEGDFTQFAPAKILVADDVQLNRDLLTGYFDGTGHEVITAVNGLEAVELAGQHRPDVILMDMRMPELDGFGVLHIFYGSLMYLRHERGIPSTDEA